MPWLAVAVLALLVGCGDDDEPPRDRPELLVSTSESGDTGIYTVNLDGSNERRIVSGASARWSPDGRRIALIVGDDTGHARLAIARADGRSLRRMPALAPLGSKWQDPQYVEWSPDGRRLAFIRALRRGEEPRFGLFTVRTNGSDLRMLVRSGNVFPDLANPAWSPDGRRIGFTRGQNRIESVRTDGTHPRVYYGRTQPSIVGGLAWSPDGRRIAFGIENGAPAWTLHVMSVAGGRPKPIGTGSSPAWSPDGRRIAYVAGSGPDGIVITGADGSRRRFLPFVTAVEVDWR